MLLYRNRCCYLGGVGAEMLKLSTKCGPLRRCQTQRGEQARFGKCSFSSCSR